MNLIGHHGSIEDNIFIHDVSVIFGIEVESLIFIILFINEKNISMKYIINRDLLKTLYKSFKRWK